MKQISFSEKNDFCTQHQTKDQSKYEADLKLYTKIFPKSRNIPSFVAANEFERYNYDGRMLLEMLDYVCKEAILENRDPELKARTEEIAKQKAIEADKARKAEKEAKAAEAKKAAEAVEAAKNLVNELIAMDMDKAKYAAKKSIFLRLGLKSADMRGDTITPILIKHKEELIKTNKEATKDKGNDKGDTPEANTETKPNQSEEQQNSTASKDTASTGTQENGSTGADAPDPEKKKEDQE